MFLKELIKMLYKFLLFIEFMLVGWFILLSAKFELMFKIVSFIFKSMLFEIIFELSFIISLATNLTFSRSWLWCLSVLFIAIIWWIGLYITTSYRISTFFGVI